MLRTASLRLLLILEIATACGGEVAPQLALREDAIIGANTADANDPFAARVVDIGGCTGTLVSNRWVLTAAHCVGATGPTSRTVTTNLGATARADFIVRHPEAPPCCGNPPAFSAMDAALLHLSSPLGTITTELANREPIRGEALTCYGYGDNTSFYNAAGRADGAGDGTLRVATLNVADPSETDLRRYTIDAASNGNIQWLGDSGGPCFNSDGNQLGVQSGASFSSMVPGSTALTVNSGDQVKAVHLHYWVQLTKEGYVGDSNYDRKPDLIWHNATTGETQVWQMNGSVRVGRATVDATSDGGGAFVGAPWRAVGINDFDYDNTSDILWHNATTGETQIWLMGGASRIGRRTVDANQDGGGALVGAPWSIVGTSDFNQDESTDILWHNASTGETQIWYMNGSSRIGRATVDAALDGGGALVGAPWHIVGANDFNRDGMADILWHNTTSGEIQIWFMNGSSRYSRATVDAARDGGGIPLIGAPWSIVGTNDFNDDGHIDIVWHNATSGETQIWFMSRSSRIGRATVSVTDGGSAFVGAPWRIVNH